MHLLENRLIDLQPARPTTRTVREAHQVLLQRARFLAPRDRTLIELALGHGVSHRRISQVLHLSSSAVTRRMQSVIRRLCNPLVIALLDPRCTLNGDLHQIGLEHFLHGCSIRRLCEIHRVPKHQVRLMLHTVRAWYRWTHPAR